MPKEEIKKLLENSKNVIEQKHSNSEKTIKDELQKFKKKSLEQI